MCDHVKIGGYGVVVSDMQTIYNEMKKRVEAYHEQRGYFYASKEWLQLAIITKLRKTFLA